MGLSIEEQETTISFFRDSDVARIFTSDSTVMTRLDKLAERNDAPSWKMVEEHRLQSGEIVGKSYETSKRLISFRSNVVTRELTDEQRKEMAERLHRAKEEGKLKKKNVEP